MLLQLNKIRRDGGTQPREYTNTEAIAEYSAAMKRGEQFPRLLTVYDGTDYWLVDGFHRAEAAEDAGLTEFECEVRQGTQADAQWMSYSVNGSHGLRRTRWDVQRAITAALQHPTSAGLSDRAIAEHIKCDHKTVGAQRSKLVAAGEVPQSDTRTTSDGRTMNVAGINANRGTSNSPAPEPDDADDKIPEPAGGWPEPDEEGNYDVELAEPFFANRGHAQAVIHVLEIKPLAWQGTRRFIANAAISGVSGCELAMPLDGVGTQRPTGEEAIAEAAQEMALHICRCLADESLLASRRATLEHFLAWANERGADRETAERELRREADRRDREYVRVSENLVYNMLGLMPEGAHEERLYANWGRIVLEMMKFAGEDDVEGRDEMRKVIEHVDVIEA